MIKCPAIENIYLNCIIFNCIVTHAHTFTITPYQKNDDDDAARETNSYLLVRNYKTRIFTYGGGEKENACARASLLGYKLFYIIFLMICASAQNTLVVVHPCE